MLEEVFTRGWENFMARTTGPMNFRFLVQPAIAIFFGIRSGLKDAREGRTKFVRSIITKPEMRRYLLREVSRDVGKLFFLAVILDFIYQLVRQREVYALELVFTAVTLAVIPYLLIRFPAGRIASWMQSSSSRKSNKMVDKNGRRQR